jgi:hypothetical protein
VVLNWLAGGLSRWGPDGVRSIAADSTIVLGAMLVVLGVHWVRHRPRWTDLGGRFPFTRGPPHRRHENLLHPLTHVNDFVDVAGVHSIETATAEPSESYDSYMSKPMRRPRAYDPAELPISEARDQFATLAESAAHAEGSITWITRRGRRMGAVVSADVVDLALWARQRQMADATADLSRRLAALPADLDDAEEAERTALDAETGLAS